MDHSKINELRSIINQYNNEKWSKNKNLKNSILSTTEYVEFIGKDIIAPFQEECNKYEKITTDYDSIISNPPIIIADLIESLKKLIPIYANVSAMIVDPSREIIHNLLIQYSRDIIDDTASIGGLFSTPMEPSENSEYIFASLNGKFKFHNQKLDLLKKSLRELSSRSQKKLATMILSKFQDHFNKVFTGFIIISICLYMYNLYNSIDMWVGGFKFAGWLIILLWIPYWFSRPTKSNRIIPLMIYASLCVLFAYGAQGVLLLLVLLFYPIKKIILFNEMTTRETRKMLFQPMAIALAIAFMITREPLWIVGLIIWIIWVYTSIISVRYFHPTFDNMSKQDSEKGELIKDSWIFVSLLSCCILIFIAGLSSTTNDFLRDLYLTSAQIALTLVGFLLAVQGVLSNISLKSETEKQKIFEKEMILKSMDGLKGYMIIFVSLFAISLLGAFSTKSTNNIELNISIFSLGSPVTLELNSIPKIYKMMIFACFMSLLTLNLAYLYYFFNSGTLFVWPFKFALLSKPVLIEEINDLTSDINKKDQILKAITNDTRLNGKIIHKILINNLDYGLFANCELEVAFPNKSELMLISQTIGSILIEKNEFSKITVWARSNQGSIGLRKIFQVDLDREKMDFLRHDDNLNKEYKFVQIGAYFWKPAYDDAYLM